MHTFALPIDGRRNVTGILDYVASDTGLTPMAFLGQTQTNRFILRQRTESVRQADIEMSSAW